MKIVGPTISSPEITGTARVACMKIAEQRAEGPVYPRTETCREAFDRLGLTGEEVNALIERDIFRVDASGAHVRWYAEKDDPPFWRKQVTCQFSEPGDVPAAIAERFSSFKKGFAAVELAKLVSEGELTHVEGLEIAQMHQL